MLVVPQAFPQKIIFYKTLKNACRTASNFGSKRFFKNAIKLLDLLEKVVYNNTLY